MRALLLVALPILGPAVPARAGEPPAALAAAAEAKLSPKKLRKHYSRTVKKHVQEASKKDGAFVVKDEVLGKDWRLKLKRIHTHKIVKLSEDTFFACADLKEAGGDKKELDLDFYVRRRGDEWVMERVVVHKVEGKSRYTYNDKNEMVPVP